MYTEYSTAEQRAAPQENISRQSAPAAAPRPDAGDPGGMTGGASC